LEVRKKCASLGFERAFITGYRNGKKVNLDESLLRE